MIVDENGNEPGHNVVGAALSPNGHHLATLESGNLKILSISKFRF